MDVENWRDPSQAWWDHAKDPGETPFEIDRGELLDLLMSSFVPVCLPGRGVRLPGVQAVPTWERLERADGKDWYSL